MEPDFSGYATKAGLKCSDGRTIMAGAFKHQDKAKVPLVWQHGHNDPENVLGHAILENREDGVYAYGYFNDSEKAEHARNLLEHGDINMLSIWANDLVERSGRVLHGAIREVSLVLSGANPGAIIENVSIRHSDGGNSVLDDEAIIYTGLELEHAAGDDDGDDDDDKDDDDLTIQDVYESMTEEQKNVLHYMVGEALESAKSDAKHDNLNNSNDSDKEGNEMKHNLFENNGGGATGPVLSHEDIKGIVADATKNGSLKEAVENYALSHGIENIDVLFPDAQAIDAVPEFLKRRTEWVAKVLGSARKSPFSRIKTLSADLTLEAARAKGYVKGNLKKEEFFSVQRRVTTPTTIYKKQKLDRDDMVDITDFDVVAWLKGEMRLMLDEEIARAILIGDGRDVASEDKINEQNIRPIVKDHELYTTTLYVNLDDSNSSVQEMIDSLVANRHMYRGSGLPTMFTTESVIARFLLLKDSLGRRIYKSLDELATELRVSEIVPVEVMEEEPEILAVLVNMNDYVVGATAGGQVSMFDDFDIDYNQHKYLIETRMCGALTRLKSAIVIRKTEGTNVLVDPEAPSFDPETGVVTIPSVTGVVYKNADTGDTLTAGAQAALDEDETLNVVATPDTGYYFASSAGDEWSFTG